MISVPSCTPNSRTIAKNSFIVGTFSSLLQIWEHSWNIVGIRSRDFTWIEIWEHGNKLSTKYKHAHGIAMMCSPTRNKKEWASVLQYSSRFQPTRGLRQGDPLSPYLFLVCAEGLSSLLAHQEEVRGIEGVKVCRNAPSVSHLLFADDSLILMKANLTNATSLRQVLD
jgi:hypothetical protein